ncbi:WS/DGAT/MGAT family O-acyltransferase [Cryptosporangium aurantiacum]|nr:wax ester/triacylglycerol synthase family O-acyltransferase [Cryptosporangium aurantiacum]
MSAMDAGFFFAEGETTPMHVGSVAVFDGPAPSYGDVVRLLLGKLPEVPRYRQRAMRVPLDLGRPVWVDDPHFQILYHVRHTAVPRPGSDEQLRNLAGRVLGQRLDLSKPLWELWLVEGLAEGRWAMINKVHHAMVDGVAGTDLMQLVFDLDPAATHPEPQPWDPQEPPSPAAVAVEALTDAVARPVRRFAGVARAAASLPGWSGAGALARQAGVLGGAAANVGRQLVTPAASSLNGRLGPHRRWAWTHTTVDEVRRVRRALGGSMNDVVVTAVAAGLRDLLAARGELTQGLLVRTMVPVSIRRPTERGTLNNQISAVFVDLPVAEPDATARLASVRSQMDANKRALSAYDPRAVTGAADLVPAPLLAAAVRTLLRSGQPWVQAVTTNVPGPPIPLFVLGRHLRSLYPYVPLGSGVRFSIGIFSYEGVVSFGVTADFDAVPDIDVLVDGIARGVTELVAAAEPVLTV